MFSELFYALDEQGKQYTPTQTPLNGSVLLTFEKEQFSKAKKLWVLPALSEAKFGEEGYYILPRALRMVGEMQIFFNPRAEQEFQYSKPLMSWYGIKKADRCLMVRVERNYFYRMEVAVRDGVYTACPVFDFTEWDKVYDDIRIELIQLPLDADYNDMARTERELRLARGEVIPLAEKCKNPATEYARKYPLIRIRMGWKPSPSPVPHQRESTEPEMFVACTFARVREIADELKRQGVEGAELQLVGWNRSGHDGRYPQLFPADLRLGGDAELKKTIDYVKALGYRISTHTNTLDSYTIADTFVWEDVVIDRDGHYKQEGHYSAGSAYRVCPVCQLKNAKRDLPKLASFGENGLHFTDVLSIIPPDVCHAAAHPSTTANGILYVRENMAYTRRLFGGFSSEGCMDFALKELDFGLYVCFGNGFGQMDDLLCDRYLPLWEVTYHGTVLYNPIATTVNFTAQPPADRLTLLMRGGKPAMYFYSKFRAAGAKNWMGENDLTCESEEALTRSVGRIKEALDLYRPFAEKQTVYLARWDFLENGLQKATYEDGSAVIGNFSDKAVTCDGMTLEPWGYRWV